MNEKQQQLLFDKGITNVPSDILCSDNALEECKGLTYDNGEHRVIQKPVHELALGNVGTDLYELIYIHKHNGAPRYILRGKGSPCVLFYTMSSDTTPQNLFVEDPVSVESIGNTLIVQTETGINYLLWTGSGYTNLGTDLPDVELKFYLSNTMPENASASSTEEHGDCMTMENDAPVVKEHKVYDDLVVGLYNKNLKQIKRGRGFANPFLLRYAYELYDGTYTRASVPILLLPSVTCNTKASFVGSDPDAVIKNITLDTSAKYLFYEWADANMDLSQWSDIIKDIVIFISDDIDVYDTIDEQRPQSYKDGVNDKIWNDGIYVKTDGISNYYGTNTYSVQSENYNFLPLTKRRASEILNDIATTSIFYKAFTIGTTPVIFAAAASRINKYTLENITTQEQLPDDYYSHCPLKAEDIYTYNNRLLLSKVTRGFYRGAMHFSPLEASQTASVWDVEVTVKTGSGNKVVSRQITTSEIIGYFYFFYPDPRAIHFKVYKGGEFMYEQDLKEHPGLNGAYWLGPLPTAPVPDTVATSSSRPVLTPTGEVFLNQIYTSEVNNPFVFKAEGNITIGHGEIIGISTLTQALSEGQFGQYPLIIFTTEGIWAAATGNTGLFTAIHPMSREVALEDNPCITQTDGAIFFASKKGLMVVVGNEVKCMSEQLSGKSSAPFPKFLETAFIAYDYRDSLLWIFDGATRSAVFGSPISWVYSIKSGTFSRFTFDGTITNVVNDYPDYKLQMGRDIYTLTGRPNVNLDMLNGHPIQYDAQIITRPLKLENGLALKTIMQMLHVKYFAEYPYMDTSTVPATETTAKGSIALTVEASDDIENWVTLNSLRGKPWKYYRFTYNFTNLIATDRFAGTMLITQERRTNKLR